jgi:hypothetical protein
MSSPSAFTPALGLEVEYRGFVGYIKFIDEEYLTVCVKKKENEMFGDVCMVVYPSQWEHIKLMGGPHRDR